MAKYIKDYNNNKLLPDYKRFTRSEIQGKAVKCTVSIAFTRHSSRANIVHQSSKAQTRCMSGSRNIEIHSKTQEQEH